MTEAKVALVQAATERIHPDYTPIIERLVEYVNGDWYLSEKIIAAPDNDSLTANSRVLKYANNFGTYGGRVTFLREGEGRTPDLLVEGVDPAFYVEVRRFGMQVEPSAHLVEKIVSAVAKKRRQLPAGHVGFVAIDNFDIHLEPALGYDLIAEALCEIERSAIANPDGWRTPSGVIVAASTTSGSVQPIEYPHFVWLNPSAEPASPADLTRWIQSALPWGRAFDCSARESETNEVDERQAFVKALEF